MLSTPGLRVGVNWGPPEMTVPLCVQVGHITRAAQRVRPGGLPEALGTGGRSPVQEESGGPLWKNSVEDIFPYFFPLAVSFQISAQTE